jgi:hypothetical protein
MSDSFFSTLFSKIWSNSLQGLSTSTLSIIIFSIVVPFLIWFIITVYKGWGSVATIKQSFKNSLPTALITISVTIIVWILIIGYYGVKTLKSENKTLTSTIDNLTNENVNLKEQIKNISSQFKAIDDNFKGLEKKYDILFAENKKLQPTIEKKYEIDYWTIGLFKDQEDINFTDVIWYFGIRNRNKDNKKTDFSDFKVFVENDGTKLTVNFMSINKDFSLCCNSKRGKDFCLPIPKTKLLSEDMIDLVSPLQTKPIILTFKIGTTIEKINQNTKFILNFTDYSDPKHICNPPPYSFGSPIDWYIYNCIR